MGVGGRDHLSGAGEYAIPSPGGEIYSVFSANWINKAGGLAPSGFNSAQLRADFNAIA
jgi:hypothetical protein